MTESNLDEKTQNQTPDAEVRTRKAFSFSPVWVVPLVALAIGGWLAFKAITDQGPTVTITFKTAEGLEAGKTKVKYKNVDIGQVEEIQLLEDLSGVILTVKMTKDSEPLLTDKTRFWVVRARVAAGQISGLGTLVSGVYIGIDPIKTGKSAKKFRGLESPPVVTTDVPGRMFFLKADKLGSLDVGAPVYYRGIKVGQVVHYDFDETGSAVDVQIFIEEPHYQEVTANSRFWNASGINVSVNATGIEINTQSLVSIVVGGIAFDLPAKMPPGDPAEENSFFKLYPNHQSINEKTYAVKNYWYLYFDESVRGLSPGAPVDFKGIQVGEVVAIGAEYLEKEEKIRIPVLIALEPERNFSKDMVDKNLGDKTERLKRMVRRGLRAQLKTGNLLTGQLYVSLDFERGHTGTKLAFKDGIPIMPTSPTPIQEVSENLGKIAKKLADIPFDQMGNDMQKTIESLNRTLEQVEKIAKNFNDEVTPNINKTLVQARKSIKDMEDSFGTDSSVSYNLKEVLKELSATIRSFRALTDYLERHPESLIRGKSAPGQ